MDRARVALAVLGGKTKAAWNYRSGTKSGYLFSGQKFKGALMYPAKFDVAYDDLRDQCRMAYWESTQARAIVGRLVDNVVGTGLALEARPVWALIGASVREEDRHAVARDIETRFDLWASSHEPDAAGKMTLYDLQAYEFLNRLRDGETFPILRYSPDPKRISPLSIQTILPETVQTPTDKIFMDAAKVSGAKIRNGIELDAYGAEIAIHVVDEDTRKFTRIPVAGASRRFVLHPMNTDTMGAVRGTSILGPMIHEIQKITDLEVAEIEAAIINAVIAAWVKPSADAPASRALAGIRGRSETSSESSATQDEIKQTTFDKPGLLVQTLKAGEEIQSFDTKRPNANIDGFIRMIVRHLSASVGVPIEVLEESFNANYSASRASLLLFWRKVEIERAKSASQFLAPIYEAWFQEEVKAGRIKAKGFNDTAVIRRAWLSCAWNGDKQPTIDPLKEASADNARIDQGATTRERVAMEYNGSDAMENMARLKTENEALAEARKPLEPVPVVAEPMADDDEKDDESEADK